jgi:lipoate-protein ligase A
VNVPILRRTGYDPRANLAFEEELFASLRADPAPFCIFHHCDACIVLGRSNVAADWVQLGAARADGIPVLRRISGGGAVYLDHGVLNYSFIVPKRMLAGLGAPGPGLTGPARYIEFFRGVVIRALARGGEGYAPSGISDINLHGRKVSGNAQRIAASIVLHHGTLIMACPLWQIERYLKIPPNRPGVPHRGFVTGLREEGRLHPEEQLREWLAQEFRSACRALAAEEPLAADVPLRLPPSERA